MGHGSMTMWEAQAAHLGLVSVHVVGRCFCTSWPRWWHLGRRPSCNVPTLLTTYTGTKLHRRHDELRAAV